MTVKHQISEYHRIALVWEDRRMQAQRTYYGICRRAGQVTAVTVQCFDAFHLGFRRGIVQPLKQWSPHGVVMRLSDLEHVQTLRRMLPEIPMVSTLAVPPEMVDSCVTSDIAEAIKQARNHFQAQGLSQIAMISSANPHAAAQRVALFRAAVPNGMAIECADGDTPSGCKKIMDWLKSLPKPVGVMGLEIGAAPFLLRACHQLGLRVPQEVQIIGADDDDVSLACEPHLTSVHLPGKRIGAKAMETMLQYLKKTSPPPPPKIAVSGCLLIPRESTGPVCGGSVHITQAVQVMKKNLRQNLSMEQLAEMSGLGLTTFYKEFVKTTGFTPAQQMRQLRLDEACRMLRESEATVTKIAKECGFKNLISFVQFFRRQTGETPSDYRDHRGG